MACAEKNPPSSQRQEHPKLRFWSTGCGFNFFHPSKANAESRLARTAGQGAACESENLRHPLVFIFLPVWFGDFFHEERLSGRGFQVFKHSLKCRVWCLFGKMVSSGPGLP